MIDYILSRTIKQFLGWIVGILFVISMIISWITDDSEKGAEFFTSSINTITQPIVNRIENKAERMEKRMENIISNIQDSTSKNEE